MSGSGSAPPARERAERFGLPLAREKWLEFLPLEHAVLPAPADFGGGPGELIVVRSALPGRPVRDGRIPVSAAMSLFLQAAAASSFFQAFGFPLTPDDLLEANWDSGAGVARLWLPRTPRAVSSQTIAAASSEILAGFLDLLLRGRRSSEHPGVRGLRAALRAPGAAYRRAEFWLAAATRSFPELASEAAAGTRDRTIGTAGWWSKTPAQRGLLEKARAIVEGRIPRIFSAGEGFPDPADCSSASRAARALRERHARETGGAKARWIAVEPEGWDPLARRAFETAARALEGEVDVALAPSLLPPPRLPDQWRREIFVPCGSLHASVRFYDRFAERVSEEPSAARESARAHVRSADWGRFVSDPTGEAPLPEPVPCEGPGSPSGRLAVSRHDAGKADAASELVEAEREAAGGRIEEAAARLTALANRPEADARSVRAGLLRLAELEADLGRFRDAGARAAAWRHGSSDASPSQILRALLVEAKAAARKGEHEEGLRLLDEAERHASALSLEERLDVGLARAAVLSRAGRFREERAVYERWRKPVLESGEEILTARLLFREALGLADRREFAPAIARLEQALDSSRDDLVEQARISICLASTLYHAGREERCRGLLDRAVELAAAAGREDLARTAKANRLELLINAGEWDEAAADSRAMLERAAADGDETRLLVALHHASRLALRRGLLSDAERDNARARELAGRLSDRLETGELWLEEGDRLLYEGNLSGARQAYETAAADPPDRCDSAEKARRRLGELEWTPGAGPPGPALDDLAALFERDEYAAAEQAARWRVLLGRGLPEPLRSRAERVLRRRGGGALADAIFGEADLRGPGAGWPAAETLRDLRAAAAASLAGHPFRTPPLADLGLHAIAVSDSEAREILRFGVPGYDAARRELDAGASSYVLVLSPPPSDAVGDAVAFVLETLLFRMAPERPPSDFSEGWRRLGVVAADSSMEEPYRRLVAFAPAPVTVLVRGESGSGKEAVARAVHALSPRAGGPFVAVNVPAIPAALLESELFGHARGAFTGADRERKGLLEEAERGTVFFDEIGDLHLPLQAKLLRALQEREIRRVGENRPRRVDIRVVSATSRDLESEVEAGRFREDLYYRLHVAVIALPPLRERGRDVALLARHFLERCSRDFGRGRLSLAPETLAALSGHAWPGNVRELQNAVSQAAALAPAGAAIGPELLPASIRRRETGAASESYRARVDEHRRGLIHEALARASGNRSRAARDLGLSRQALAYLIRELGVTVATGGPR